MLEEEYSEFFVICISSSSLLRSAAKYAAKVLFAPYLLTTPRCAGISTMARWPIMFLPLQIEACFKYVLIKYVLIPFQLQ